MAIKSLDKSSLVTPQTTNSMLAGYSFQDFELIESVFVASDAASVTFSNLNQYATEYKHLQIRIVGRTNFGTTNGDFVPMRFNSDSGANYSVHALWGTGSSVSSFSSVSDTRMALQRLSTAANASGVFSPIVIDIADAFASKSKTVRSLGGGDLSNGIFFLSGAWYNNAAINLITFSTGNGSAFTAGSRFSLYGIR
jgi:hypothetical protein